MSWRDLHTHKEDTQPIGCISTSAPPKPAMPAPPSVTIPPVSDVRYTLQQSDVLTEEDAKFVLEHGGTGNRALLDLTLQRACQGHILRLNTGSLTCGFILSIAHRLYLRDASSGEKKDEVPLPPLPGMVEEVKISIRSDLGLKIREFRCGLTTHLCIHQDYREQRLAMMLIQSIIKRGHERGINVGYHYMATPRTKSQVAVKAWYRPLHAQAAAAKGYDLLIPKLDGVRDIGTVAAIMYNTRISEKHTYRATRLSDFSTLTQRYVGVMTPSKDEWKRIGSQPFKWITILAPSLSEKEGKVALVACYRPFPIHSPKGLINAAQLVYLETSAEGEDGLEYIETLIGFIAKERYIVLHGLEQGPLVGLSDRLKLIRVKELYLDFYNLAIGTGVRAEQVNLLYV